MRALITGIGGFAGSHLAEFLSDQANVEVCGITKKTRLDWHGHREIKRYDVDIRDRDRLARKVADIRPDFIFHLAGQAYVPAAENAAAVTFESNVLGTINVLESAKRLANPARVLVVSSGAVYGEVTANGPLPDESFPLHPTNPYTASKAAADVISQSYRSSQELDVVIARPFNHTGPRQAPTYVCSTIAQQFAQITQGKRKAQLELGNTKAKRDFSDVRDVVRAYWIMTQNGKGGEFIFNVASGEIYSIQQVVDILSQISGIDVEVKTANDRLRDKDIGVLAGSAGRLRALSDWKPHFTFDRTLKDLYEYHLQTS